MAIPSPPVSRTAPRPTRFAVAAFGVLMLGSAPPNVEAQTSGQPPTATSTSAIPAIEVASIKRNKDVEDRRNAVDPLIPQVPGRAQTLRGGNIVGRGMTVKELIRDAYGFRNRAKGEVIGAPAWVDTEVYDVQARFNQEFPLSTSVLPPSGEMALRALLADRFHLKAHFETRRRPVYELVVNRSDGRLGPNLKPSKGGCVPFFKREAVNVGLVLDRPPAGDPEPVRPCMASIGLAMIVMENTAMEDWAKILALRPQLDRTVIDRTGLTGNFDFELRNEAAMQPGAPILLPPLKPMLESQLGLTVRDAEDDVEVLLIDSIDHPTEN